MVSEVIWSIIGALLMLSLLVVVHELGHYGAARIFKLKVDEFSVGFGPRLFGWVSPSGTDFCWRLLPFGGSCRFRGEDAERGYDPEALQNQKAWKRLIMQFSGPLLNIVFAYVIALVLMFMYGNYAAQINSVTEGSAAQSSGLLPGDTILSVDGAKVTVDTLRSSILGDADGNAVLGVKRDGQMMSVEVRGMHDPATNTNALGIAINAGERISVGFFEGLASAGKTVAQITREILGVFVNIFKKPETLGENLSGPVGTVAIIGQGIRSGLETSLWLSLLISVNLGIFNLLPVPGLDGARMIFSVSEMIRRKPLSQQVEGGIHLVGFALLMVLMVYASYGDIMRLFGGAR